jgi:hypothetical protein
MHGISVFCYEMVKPQAWYQCVLSWNGQAPCMVSVCFVMKWSSPMHDWYYAWGLTISWQHTLIPCMGLDHFMTKQTDTMHWACISVFCHEMVRPHAWYQCVLSWNDQAPCMAAVCFVMKWSSPMHGISVFGHMHGLDHLMTKQTDTMSGDWQSHDKTHR